MGEQLPGEATFTFEDGGEAVMRLAGLSTRRLLELTDFLWDGDWATPEGARRMAELVDEFRVSWTYEGDGLDRSVLWNHALLRAWLREVGAVPVPLPVRRFEPAP